MIQKIIRDTDGNVITEKPIGEIEIIRPPLDVLLSVRVKKMLKKVIV